VSAVAIAEVRAKPGAGCAQICCRPGAIWVFFRLRASLEGSDALAFLSACFLLAMAIATHAAVAQDIFLTPIPNPAFSGLPLIFKRGR
jgi:hypothetical protein